MWIFNNTIQSHEHRSHYFSHVFLLKRNGAVMYLQIASVRNKLFSRSPSKTVKLLQRVVEEKWTRYFHVFIPSTGLQANMMAFWLERFVGLGARDSHLVPGQKLNASAPVRGSKIFIIHRVSSLALVDQPLTINKVRCRKLLKFICSLQ